MRVGIGYDIHRLVKGRRLVLGGVDVPHSKGLEGHSDGDALSHAVVDAALGAAGLGDIGGHFSDKDARNKGRDSADFVRHTRKLLAKKGLRVTQIDTIVIAEEPKLSGYKEKIRKTVAAQWGVPAADVNVKAKTHEGLGAIGEGRAIACHAVVVLKKGKRA